MNLRSMLEGLPDVMQYVVVLGLVMLILYVCLTITRILGQNRGEQQRYDDPEAYEKSVPDLFASTFLKRKVKQKDEKQSDADEQ